MKGNDSTDQGKTKQTTTKYTGISPQTDKSSELSSLTANWFVRNSSDSNHTHARTHAPTHTHTHTPVFFRLQNHMRPLCSYSQAVHYLSKCQLLHQLVVAWVHQPLPGSQ